MEIYNYIGDNAPNYRIELSGGEDLKETIVEKQYNNTHNTATPLKFNSEYIIPSINLEGELQIDVFKTNKFLYGDFEPDDIVIYDDITFDDKVLIPIPKADLGYHSNCISATVLDSGELHIYLSLDIDNRSGGYLIAGFDYRKLKLKSVMLERQLIGRFTKRQDFGTTEPFKTNAGYIVIGVDNQYPHQLDREYNFRRMELFVSKDKGISWQFIAKIGSGFGANAIQRTNGFFRFKDKGYITIVYSSGGNNIYEVNKTASEVKVIYSDLYDTDYSQQLTFEEMDKGQYVTALSLKDNVGIKIYTPKKTDTFLELVKKENNEVALDFTLRATTKLKSTKVDNKIIFLTYLTNKTFFTIIEPLKTSINQDVIDISIDRPKNMIGSATIKLNNYMGKYSPDGEINPYKLYPNKEIVIYLGYGENLKKAFTGYIDSIQMNSFPHIITIQCRDTLKLCKDQLLYYNNKYTNTFKNRTPENLFRLLCEAVGVRYGTVEKTGIRLAEVEWNYVSVYDCMEEIAELSGFELSCDENGVLHFREEKPKENQPIVKSFKEGKNITTLDYSIDDSELYHSVIAQGKKEKEITVKNKKGKKVKKKVEEIISYRDYWEPRNFYNLPKNKILVVDVSEADNKTDLKKVVDQALYLMTCRARQVSFEAIADTSLRVGDMIRVEETGSTISEVYRITGIGFDLNNSGYTMTIECYHHRNIKPEEDKEE